MRRKDLRSLLTVKIGQVWSRPSLDGEFANLPVVKGMRKKFVIIDVGTKYAVVRNVGDNPRVPTRGIKLSRLLSDSEYRLEEG